MPTSASTVATLCVCLHSLTCLRDWPLLQDQRLSFRLKRQQFIELLRQETPEADSAALGEQAHLHRAVPGGLGPQ